MACWIPVFILNKTYWIKPKKSYQLFLKTNGVLFTQYQPQHTNNSLNCIENMTENQTEHQNAMEAKVINLNKTFFILMNYWPKMHDIISCRISKKKHCLLTYKTTKYNVCSICSWKLKNKLNPNIVVTLLPEIFQFNPSFSKFISLIISWSSPKS